MYTCLTMCAGPQLLLHLFIADGQRKLMDSQQWNIQTWYLDIIFRHELNRLILQETERPGIV